MGDIGDHPPPDFITPLECYVASEASSITHEVFSVGGGSYARAFVGLTKGWNVGGKRPPTIEEVEANVDNIRDTDGFWISDEAVGEIKSLADRLADSGSEPP